MPAHTHDAPADADAAAAAAQQAQQQIVVCYFSSFRNFHITIKQREPRRARGENGKIAWQMKSAKNARSEQSKRAALTLRLPLGGMSVRV